MQVHITGPVMLSLEAVSYLEAVLLLRQVVDVLVLKVTVLLTSLHMQYRRLYVVYCRALQYTFIHTTDEFM